MATVYVPDNVLMKYAAAEGDPEAAKDRIKQVVKENAPETGGGDD